MTSDQNKAPNFFIVGAAKAGTTSLSHYLATHREIFISAIKEPHYFSRQDINPDTIRPAVKERIAAIDVNREQNSSGTPVIHNYFVRDDQEYFDLFSNVNDEIAIGECSTSYLWAPSAASAIYNFAPDAKIIAVLRNPVFRAFSHFLMEKRLFENTNSFEQELKTDKELGARTWEVFPMYHELGNYYTQLKRYYDLFPASNIKVIIFDDFKREREQTVFDIFTFLGVGYDGSIDLTKVLNKGSVPRNKLVRWAMKDRKIKSTLQKSLNYETKQLVKKIIFTNPSTAELSGPIKDYLIEYYTPEVNKLGTLINRDLSFWLNIE